MSKRRHLTYQVDAAGNVRDGRPTHRPLADRLAARVDSSAGPTGCWPWRGALGRRGYGRISLGYRHGAMVYSHRAAWEVAHGAIPDGVFVCHRCDNPPCCNPAHLFLGTHAENMADMKSKRRQARAERLPHTRLDAEKLSLVWAFLDAGAPKTFVARAFGVTDTAILRAHRRRLDANTRIETARPVAAEVHE